MTSLAMRLLERDLVPDFLIRRRIRSLLAARLREEDQGDPERQQQRLVDFIQQALAKPGGHRNRGGQRAALRSAHRVLRARARQAPQVFQLAIIRIPNAAPAANLEAAEARMLALTCQRARLDDGQTHPRARLRLGLA